MDKEDNMKNFISTLLVLLTILSFPGFSQTTDINKIENYKAFLMNYSSKFLAEDFNDNQIDQMEIQYMKNTIEKVYENDPVQILKMKNKSADEIRKKCGSKKELWDKLRTKKLGSIEASLKEIIKNNITSKEYKIFETQMIIRGKIINVKENNPENDDFVEIVYFKIKVNDIIKGNKTFRIDDEIMVFYNKKWLKQEVSWEEGKEYLFELEYRPRKTGKYEIGIITYHGENKGYYPIVKNMVFDKSNHFEEGHAVSLSVLKEKIIKSSYSSNTTIEGNHEEN